MLPFPEDSENDTPPHCPSDDTSDDRTIPKPEDMRLKLLGYQVAMINYCIRHSYSLERWRKVVNVMILKEPGNVTIHRLQVLHLYEADYSALLAIKWRALMHHAVDNDLIHSEQYGGVPGKDSITPAYMEEIQWEITRATRRPIVKTDFDATSCYDRIIPSLASLVGRAHGQHHLLCQLHADMLRRCQYLLKTDLGVTETGYSHTKTTPIYGTGQGSPNSPTIWCLLSSRLFQAHEQQAQGAVFETPDQSIEVSFSMIGLVDNTYGTINRSEDFHQNLRFAEEDAQLWCSLLAATGGALEAPKCKYHAIHFEFSKSGLPVMKYFIHADDQIIPVGDGSTENAESFERLRPDEAHRILGCYKAPNGQQDTAYETIAKNAEAKATLIANSRFDPKCAWRYYMGVFLPSVTYSFAVNFISPAKLWDLTKKTTRPFIAKLGFARSTPLNVVYGSRKYGGIGLHDFRVTQGVEQMCIFVKHWRSYDSTAGKLSRIALAWAQHNSGSEFPLLEYPEYPVPHLETPWFSSLRTFLSQARASIRLDRTFAYPRQRENDQYLMDAFKKSRHFDDREMRILNYCRLYLQVTVTSDICEPTGRRINRWMVDGDASPTGTTEMNDKSVSRDLVAIQAKPDLPAWRLWKSAILRVFTTTDKKAFKDITQRTLWLRKPLGKWLHPFHKLKRSWKNAYSPSQDAIYSYVGNNQYSVHDDNVSTGRDAETYPIFRSSFDKTVFKLPLDCEPTGAIFKAETISLKRKELLGVHRGAASYTPKVPARPEWAEHLPDWEWEILKNTQPCRARGISRHSKVAGDIEVASRKSDDPNYKQMLIVTDGSVRHNRGAFGWVLALPDGTRLVEGQGPAYGHEISSFKAEDYGMLSALRYIHHIAKHYNVPLPLKF